MERVGIVLVNRFLIAGPGVKQILRGHHALDLLHFLLKAINESEDFNRGIRKGLDPA